MTPLADAVVRMSLVIAAGLAASWALRSRSAALRHWIVAAALGCATITPLLGAVLPTWGPAIGAAPAAAPVAVRETRTFAAAGDTATGVAPARAEGPGLPPGAAPIPWWPAIWLSGTVLAVASLCIGLVRLRRLAAHAGPPDARWLDESAALARAYGLSRPVALFQTDHPSLLVTWGTRRPCILLPASAAGWSRERMHVVLAHELAHVARGDWAAQMGAELLRTALWFNPLAWVACRRLRHLSEYACDDLVLGLGVLGPDYASHLLDLARSFRAHGHLRVPAPAIARPSTLRKRITAMLTTTLDRRPLTRTARALSAAAVLALSIFVAGLGAQSFATLSGTVLDQSSAYVPDVTLTLTNTANEAKHEVRSDATGRFEFVGLPPGDYQLQSKRVGFETTDQTVTLVGDQALDRTITMPLGHLVETIRVNGRPAVGRPRVQTATPPAPQPCVATSVGGNIKAPRKIKDVRPVLDPGSDTAALSGTVVVDARIGTDGMVVDAQVVDGAHPDLDAAALDAVRQWQFTPTLLNCQRVEVMMTVTVTFEAAQ